MTTAVPPCAPVPLRLPPADSRACAHTRGGRWGLTQHHPPLSCAQEGPRQMRSLSALLPPLPGQPPWWLLPDFIGPRISPKRPGPLSAPLFQITDRDWPVSSAQGTPQQRAQSQVFGGGVRQSSPLRGPTLASWSTSWTPWPPGVLCMGALGKGHSGDRDRRGSPALSCGLAEHGAERIGD